MDSFLTGIAYPLLNTLFVFSVIAFGGCSGSYTKKCRSAEHKKADSSGFLFGVSSAFICVPFLSSFLNIDFSSMIFPIAPEGKKKLIEQTLLLVSVSGIASYLGHALLDGLASKVLQQEMRNMSEKQNEMGEGVNQIKANYNKTNFELAYLKSTSAVDKYESLLSSGNDDSAKKKLNEALVSIDQAIDIASGEARKEFTDDDRDKVLVMKAYILKRLTRIDEALRITEQLLEKDENNPILLYNKACYMYLLNKDNGIQKIKDMVVRALTVPVCNEEFKRRQSKIRIKVLASSDDDIAGLFSPDEIDGLRERLNQ